MNFNKDANRNGIPDNLERRNANDMNGNRIPDKVERLWNKDINGNGIPDKLERSTPNDMNGNRIPDSVERLWNKDMNKNGIPDKLERGSTWNDRNGNGISDNLERGSNWNDRNGNGIPDNLEQRSSTWNDRNGNGIPDNLEGRGYNYNASTYGVRTTTAPIVQQVVLPTQVVEKPMAIHEEIRRERVEEIQPVVNVEKLKTEIHQVTQPLFDKEVRPVNVSRQVLDSQILPEVHLPGSGVSAAREASSVNYLDTRTVTVEKPAIFVETEKKQIIEEIQPVLYKETIVPTVIQETKPVFQKIVEGPVYVQETLAPRSLHGSSYAYSTGMTMDANRNGIPDVLERGFQQPFVQPQQHFQTPVVENIPVTIVKAPQEKLVTEKKIITTTTTTTGFDDLNVTPAFQKAL